MNSRHEDFQSSALPTELSRLASRSRAPNKGIKPDQNLQALELIFLKKGDTIEDFPSTLGSLGLIAVLTSNFAPVFWTRYFRYNVRYDLFLHHFGILLP